MDQPQIPSHTPGGQPTEPVRQNPQSYQQPVQQPAQTQPANPQPRPAQPATPVPDEQKTSVAAILSLIFSLVFILAPVGLILGIVALVKISHDPRLKGKGLAIAGLIIGGLGTIVFLFLLVIAPMAYFGVLSPDKILPERCTGPAGLDCLEKAEINADSDTITVALKNNLGTEITLTSVEGTEYDYNDCLDIGETAGVGLQIDGVASEMGTSVSNGNRIVLTMQCSKDIKKGRTEQDFYIKYTTPNGLEQRGLISVRGQIQ